MDSWGGRSQQAVTVCFETASAYYVVSSSTLRVRGRHRYAQPGELARVPKYAVRFAEQ